MPLKSKITDIAFQPQKLKTGKMLIWYNPTQPIQSKSVALFLDRDGVINQDSPEYIKNVSEFKIFDDVVPALKLATLEGYSLIITSNQSGLGRGIIKPRDFWEIHFYLVNFLKANGCPITAAFYCPHHPEDGCSCRKPRPGMLMAAAEMFNISLNRSFFIGDKLTDMEAARKAGCKGIFVVRKSNAYYSRSNRLIFRNLFDAISSLSK